VDSARGDERIATAITNPQVNLSRGVSGGGYDPLRCPGCSNVQWTAGASDQGGILDALTGKRHFRVAAARAALEAAKHSRADAERIGAFAVKQQYVAAVVARDSLIFAKDTAKSTAETLRLVDVRYKAGAVSEADVARAETDKLESDQGVDQATQSLRQAQVALAFLLGARASVPEFDLGDEFETVAVPPGLAAASREGLLKMALDNRPDLKSAESQESSARAALSLEHRERIPDVDISFQYSKEGTGQNAIQPPTAAWGASLTLPLFYQRQGESAKAEAALRTQELQKNKVETQVVSDVETAYAAFVGAQQRAIRMDTRLLERARRARDLVGVQYEKGAASLLELLDAQRTLIATNTERLQDLGDYWTAVFQLEEAVGTELRQ